MPQLTCGQALCEIATLEQSFIAQGKPFTAMPEWVFNWGKLGLIGMLHTAALAGLFGN